MNREELLRKIDITRTNYGLVRDEEYHIALLPWGATEPHNLHLPYLTDCLLSQAIALDAAMLAWERGVHAMVLPPVPYGSQNPGQRELPFCIHARYRTQYAILQDTVESLQTQGIKKLVIISGHGGNNFKNMIRDLAIDFPNFTILAGDWFKAVKGDDYFTEPGDHAGELETAVMMHYFPEWVNLDEAGEGAFVSWALPSLREGFAWLPRNWQKVSRDTGVGDPRRATVENGKAFADASAKKWAELLVELVQNDDLYEPLT